MIGAVRLKGKKNLGLRYVRSFMIYTRSKRSVRTGRRSTKVFAFFSAKEVLDSSPERLASAWHSFGKSVFLVGPKEQFKRRVSCRRDSPSSVSATRRGGRDGHA